MTPKDQAALEYSRKARAALADILPGWTDGDDLLRPFRSCDLMTAQVDLPIKDQSEWRVVIIAHPGLCRGEVVVAEIGAPAKSDPANAIVAAIAKAQSTMLRMSQVLSSPTPQHL